MENPSSIWIITDDTSQISFPDGKKGGNNNELVQLESRRLERIAQENIAPGRTQERINESPF